MIKRLPLLALVLASTLGAAPRPDSLSLAELLTRLRDEGRLGPFVQWVQSRLRETVPEELQEPLRATLERFAGGDFAGWERFPRLPSPARLAPLIEGSRLLLGSLPEKAPDTTVPVTGPLTFPRPCRPRYEEPAPLSPHLPGIGYGHFPDRTLDACVFEDSGRLARVLGALAARNGSWVEYRGRRVETAADLVAALLRSGHRITVRDERMYADFLSLALLDGTETYVRLPVWLETGLSFQVPVLHSHHAWYVEGPDVSARVAFYLGIDGVGFFPLRSRRPLWTGQAVRFQRTAEGWDSLAPYVVATVAGAEAYADQVRRESATVARGFPAQGYGYLGVCNDSNAFLSSWTAPLFPVRHHELPYPLLRSARLPGPVVPDTAAPGSEALLLCRILGSYPHGRGGNGFDPLLASQMEAVHRTLLRRGLDAGACRL